MKIWMFWTKINVMKSGEDKEGKQVFLPNQEDIIEPGNTV